MKQKIQNTAEQVFESFKEVADGKVSHLLLCFPKLYKLINSSPYVTELDLRHSLVPDEVIEDLLASHAATQGPRYGRTSQPPQIRLHHLHATIHARVWRRERLWPSQRRLASFESLAKRSPYPGILVVRIFNSHPRVFDASGGERKSNNHPTLCSYDITFLPLPRFSPIIF